MNEMYEKHYCEYVHTHGTSRGAHDYAIEKCKDDYMRGDHIIARFVTVVAVAVILGAMVAVLVLP